jgi:hypothetical protein
LSANVLAIPAIIGFVAAIVWLGFRAARKQGAAEARADDVKAGQELEREAIDVLTKAPADPASVIEWMRHGGRDS